MKLSDLIKALQHLQQTHGDLPVLERRQVWHESTEFFKEGIQVDQRVLMLAGWYEPTDGKHHYHEQRFVAADVRDRQEFKAFTL